MKTLIVILAAALASPAFGHTDVSKSNTSSSSTSSSSAPVYEDSSSMSGSSSSDSASAPISEEEESSSISGSSTSDEDYATSTNDDSNLSGSSSTTDSEEVDSSSSLSGASTSSSDVSTSGGTTTTTTTTTTPSATDPSYSGSASGAAAPGATSTSPGMTAPAATAAPAATPPATAETTSRTYSEMEAEDRNVGGLYIEPAIFGSQQDADIEGRLGADQTGEVNGFGGDLKFGGHVNEMFFLAANARYERSQFEESALGDADADTYNWGPTVGVQAPWMGARVWGSYIIDGSADPEAAANGVNLKFDDPYGWRVGAGIRLAAVSLNLEYQDLTYRTTEIQSTGTAAGVTDAPIDFAQRGYSVSLSFPFQL